jgi:hypothetical protein
LDFYNVRTRTTKSRMQERSYLIIERLLFAVFPPRKQKPFK